jgi:hypothetical protein
VERYFTANGFMLPTYQKFYWTGLQSTSGTWPNFTWVDNRTPGPSNSSSYYTHWGRFRPSTVMEPNNLITPPELCGGAAASAAPLCREPGRPAHHLPACAALRVGLQRLLCL